MAHVTVKGRADLRRVFDCLKCEESVNEFLRKQTTESLWLDFKSDAYEPSFIKPKPKKAFELRKDVVAFANAQGGIIFCGVAETGEKVSGLVGVCNGVDAEKRIREILSSNIQPLLLGVEVRRIDLENGRAILLVYIPGRRQGTIYSVRQTPGLSEVFIRVDKSNRVLPESEIENLRQMAPEFIYSVPSLAGIRIASVVLTNFITLLRPFLGLFAGYKGYEGDYFLAALLYSFGLLTDFMDGAVAVMTNGATERGKDFDRWADGIFNCLSIGGYVLGTVLRGTLWAGIILALATGGLVSLTRLWIEPHSALAKIRSGVIRCVFLFFLMFILTLSQLVILALGAGVPLLGAAVYELRSLEGELKSGKRPFRRWS